MSFNRFRTRAPQTARTVRVVFAIGRRVFVHRERDDGGAVTVSDEQGNPTTVDLRDGTEVEVLAWRPRGSAGTRYRVRSASAGVDGWLGADELRAGAARPPAPPAPENPDAQRWGFGSGSRGSR